MSTATTTTTAATMFPILLRARGSMQGFAWRSVDDPDGAIVRDTDRLFFAPSLPALIERWRARDPDAPVDESVLSIDLDALIAELRRGAQVSRRPMSEADRGAIADWLEAGADMVCAATT